ncbi:flippase [Clostridium thermarum]|uniref:flippase n=1 Tax=Clostridium thermarum TaxID=1716543 RepID=UPI00111EE9C5|nr:flippase [Clostridium thermarum]
MSKKSLKKNFIFNLIFTLMNIIYPIITLPYVSRVLMADNLGKVNLAISLINWLIIIASVGIPTYGIREIARVREDKRKLSKVFSELMIIKFFATVFTVIAYVTLLLSNEKFSSELSLYIVTGLNLFLNIFSMDWFYQGIEEYGYITSRSIILKLISLILMFITVTSSEDYVYYAILSVFANSFGNIINFIYSKRFVKIVFKDINFMYHLQKIKFFFFASLVFSIYTQFDSVILGFFKSNTAVAYYTRTKQVINLGLIFSSSLTQVMLPRVSYLFQKNKYEYRKAIEKSVDYVYIISIPLTSAVIVLSHEVMMVLGGSEFINAKYSLQIAGVVIIVNSLGTLMYSQVLLPTGNESKSLNVHLITAFISLCLSLLLIPNLSYIGAAIVYTLSQLFGNFYGVYISKKISNIRLLTKSLLKYFFGTIMMTLTILIVKHYFIDYLQVLIISCVLGIITYFTILIILKEELTIYILRSLFSKFKNRILSR